MIVMEDVDMRKYTTFKAGGRARKMLVCESERDVADAIEEIKEKREKYIVIGNGSNILVRDAGFDGVVITLGQAFSKVEVVGERMVCGSCALMSAVAKKAAENELAGFEFAGGIPGSIGGAFFMNAGAYGGEIKDIAESARVLSCRTGEIETIARDEMDFSYRHSSFQESGDIILSVTISLEKGSGDEISARLKELLDRRNAAQPVNYPSAGSFFKRPEGYFAGKLIQDAGMKGVSVGGAQVSEKHTGFIINKGNATATDITDLMVLVQESVYKKFGVRLEPEVKIIGD